MRNIALKDPTLSAAVLAAFSGMGAQAVLPPPPPPAQKTSN
jgi:hypothetical protein